MENLTTIAIQLKKSNDEK